MAPAVQKKAGPHKPPSPGSRQDEDPESADDEPRQFRRVRIRCRQGGRETMTITITMTIRCICGAQHNDSRLLPWHALNDPTFARSNQAWLIQCGECKAWQHRSCVGAENGYDPPAGFYCERCTGARLAGLENPLGVFIDARAGIWTSSLVPLKVHEDRRCVRMSRRRYTTVGHSQLCAVRQRSWF